MQQRQLRVLHRWLGLVAGLQLLAWTASGLYFTLIPITEIRGNHILDKTPAALTLGNLNLIAPQRLISAAAVDPQTGQAQAGSPDIASTDIGSIRLASVLEQPVWLLAGQRFDAVSGTLLPPVTEDQARQIVNHRSSFAVKHAEWIETVAPDSEYRGGELPAWRLHLQDADDAVIYVGAHSGAIRAVRTTPWRWFDFLWMLHVMDYEERENFNHWLIQAMAILGLATVLSGLILFGWSQTSQWQRRRHRRATA